MTRQETTVPPDTTTTTLYDEMIVAEREHGGFVAELKSIGAKLDEAARLPDADRIVALRRRRDELGAHIYAAQLKMMRLSIALMQERAESFRQQMPAAEAKMAKAQRDLELAQKVHEEALFAYQDVAQMASSAEADAAERRRLLEDTLRRDMSAAGV